MTNWKFKKEEADDLEFFGFYKKLVDDLKLLTHDEMMAASHKIARDTARTPVQWSDDAHGGFTTGKPWIYVQENHKTINVKNQINDPESVLSFYKQIIKLRKSHELLMYGQIKMLFDEDLDVFGYLRWDPVYYPNDKFYFISNVTGKPRHFHTGEFDETHTYEVLLCNYDDYEFNPKNVNIKPWLGALIRATKKIPK